MPASRITADERGQLLVPDEPIVPFVEGDGVGPETCRVARRVVDLAVAKAFGGARRIAWLEVAAGDRAIQTVNDPTPDAAVNAFRLHRVGLKGPLKRHPGKRLLDDELRDVLDLSTAVVPLRAPKGPLATRLVGLDLVLVQEEREEAGARVDLRSGTSAPFAFYDWLSAQEPAVAERLRFGSAAKLDEWLDAQGRLPTGLTEIAVGVRQVSRLGAQRFADIVARAARSFGRTRLTLLHEAGEQGVVDASFQRWAHEAFASQPELTVEDASAATVLETLLRKPNAYALLAGLAGPSSVLVRALGPSLGGGALLGRGQLGALTGHAVFGPLAGTREDLAGSGAASPGGFLVAGELLLRHLGWSEAAELVRAALERTLGDGLATAELVQILGASERPTTLLRTADFGDAVARAI